MALLIVIVSIGITAHKMVCLGSGAVSVSFFKTQDCCTAESKNSDSVSGKCCDFSTSYFKLDFRTLVSNLQFKVDVLANAVALSVFIFNETDSTQLVEANHSPPLISGKDIRILFSVFRI